MHIAMYKLSLAQKRKIVTFCERNKKMSYQKAANVMSDVLGRKITKMAIFRALRQKERILKAPNFGHGYQLQSELDQKFETALFLILKKFKIITKSVVIKQAMTLRDQPEYRESRFQNSKFCHGWYIYFCKRYQLQRYRPQRTINFNKIDEDLEISVEEIDTKSSDFLLQSEVII